MTSLAHARVLIVGAGGLGCPAALALARGGVGHLTLADPDRVDVSNLHRQLWHWTSDVGRLKVASASDRLRAAFPRTHVEPLAAAVERHNAAALFTAHDLVVDATDGAATKLFLSDVAVATRTPLVYGGVLRSEGQVMLIVAGGPCLRCLYEDTSALDAVPSCAQAGVLGAMTGAVGACQALLAMKRLSAPGAALGAAELYVLDGGSLQARAVRVERAPGCVACAAGEAVGGLSGAGIPERGESCAR